jgi:NADPH2:quinone reductase
MKAAWYEKQGAAKDVLIVDEMDDPQPGEGEVRIRLAASGINPGDVKKRQNAFGYGIPYPRIIPHSDGAGTIDQVGRGVPKDWIGKRVWCHGAQTYRPFGTAAEYTVVPLQQAVLLPPAVSMEQGACLGIPGITAHRAVHVAGPVDGRVVLVQGGAGAVGGCAVRLAHQAGARVIATCRSERNREAALQAGADEVLLIDEYDVPPQAKMQAAGDVNRALEEGWRGLPIAARFPLDDIASAHEFVERPTRAGRVILTL